MEAGSISKLSSAMAKAQGEFRHAKRASRNPTFESAYADLSAVIDTIRTALAKNDLWYTQPTNVQDDGAIIVETVIYHSSGERLSCGRLRMKPADPGPQAQGSTLTYARRYGLCAAFGVAVESEDDDGERAEGRKSAPVPAQSPEERRKADGVERPHRDSERPPPTASRLDPEKLAHVVRKLPENPTEQQAKMCLLQLVDVWPESIRDAALNSAAKDNTFNLKAVTTATPQRCLAVYQALRKGAIGFLGKNPKPAEPEKEPEKKAEPKAEEKPAEPDPIDSFLTELDGGASS